MKSLCNCEAVAIIINVELALLSSEVENITRRQHIATWSVAYVRPPRRGDSHEAVVQLRDKLFPGSSSFVFAVPRGVRFAFILQADYEIFGISVLSRP
jgi:hypothetical protein